MTTRRRISSDTTPEAPPEQRPSRDDDGTAARHRDSYIHVYDAPLRSTASRGPSSLTASGTPAGEKRVRVRVVSPSNSYDDSDGGDHPTSVASASTVLTGDIDAALPSPTSLSPPSSVLRNRGGGGFSSSAPPPSAAAAPPPAKSALRRGMYSGGGGGGGSGDERLGGSAPPMLERRHSFSVEGLSGGGGGGASPPPEERTLRRKSSLSSMDSLRDLGGSVATSVGSMGKSVKDLAGKAVVAAGLGASVIDADLEGATNYAAQWDVRLAAVSKKMMGGKYRRTLAGSLPTKLSSVKKKRRRIRIESTATMFAPAGGGGGGSGSASSPKGSSKPLRSPRGSATSSSPLSSGSGGGGGHGGHSRFAEVPGPELAARVAPDDEIWLKVLKPVSERTARKAKSVRVRSTGSIPLSKSLVGGGEGEGGKGGWRRRWGSGGGSVGSENEGGMDNSLSGSVSTFGSMNTLDSDSDDETLDDDDMDDDMGDFHESQTILHDRRSDVFWKVSYTFPIDRLTVVRRNANDTKCLVAIGTGAHKKEREIHFATGETCSSFVGTMRQIDRKMKERTEVTLRETLRMMTTGDGGTGKQGQQGRTNEAAAAAAARPSPTSALRSTILPANGNGGGGGINGAASAATASVATSISASMEGGGGSRETLAALHRPVNLLIEIVSATDLRDADVTGSSDPYVIVRMGDRILHKTHRIDNDLNPIWTLQTRSLFLIEDTTEEFIRGGPSGVTFEVFDYDSLGKHEALGQVTLKQRDLLAMEGERMEYPLRQVKSKHKSQGILTIRCRRATEVDIRFMGRLRAEKSLLRKKGVAGQRDFISPLISSDVKFNSLKRQTREVDEIVEEDDINGDKGLDDSQHTAKEKAYRVRPYPDPSLPPGTDSEWMTRRRIEETTYQRSRYWVEGGTGSLGKLYVEVLGCDDLPNMDMGNLANKRDKTDAFVMVLFGDAIVSTDVIPDCLSPRFFPWTRRAFVFGIDHPTTQLLLGVHDWDIGLNANDPIGRVSIGLESFAPDTEYVLHYKLYDTAIVPERKSFGTISIRLSVEWNDARRLFKEGVDFPPREHINMQAKKHYKTAYYTIEGGKDVYRYSLDTIFMQLDELYEIWNVVYDVFDAAVHVVMWRGHFKVRLPSLPGLWRKSATLPREVELPLHSVLAFLSGILLVERPQMFPAIFVLSIGWSLLALLERRNSRPSPWGRVPSYMDMVRAYATGTLPRPRTPVEANQYEEEDRAYVEAWTTRRNREMTYVNTLYDEKMKEWEDVAAMTGEGGDIEDLTSRSTNKLVRVPFKSYFYPYQVWFDQLCHTKRFAAAILNWDHYFLSFAITTASLVVGFVFLLLPWGFLFLWTGRLLVWIGLGPWMKFVDVYYVRDLQNLSEKNRKRRERWRLRRKKETLEDTFRELRIQKENALKLAAMKKHVFGDYIVSMPHLFKLDRYRDEPLPNSSSRPIPKEERMESIVNIKNKVPGQSLEGTMIPENIHSHVDLSVKEDLGVKKSLMKKLKHRKHD